MISRVFGFVVIAMLVLAAADVYRIKSEASAQVAQLAKLRSEIQQDNGRIRDMLRGWQ